MFSNHNNIFLHSDRVRSAEVDGTVYFANKSVVVCCDFDESTDMPTFGEITDIVVTPSRKVLFVMQTLVTDYFEQHYFAYCVHRVHRERYIYRPSELLDPYPLILSRTFSSTNSGLFVRTKHHNFAFKVIRFVYLCVIKIM